MELSKCVLFSVIRHKRKSYLQEGSRAIAAEENCPPTPKLTLTQTLNLTRGQFYLGAIVWLSPTLKLTLTLTQIPTLTGGQLSGYFTRNMFRKDVD